MNWFSSRKLKLNKSYFARNKWRENSDLFSNAFYMLQVLSNVLVAVFFSPVVATPIISVQDLLVMITNVVLALKYLYEFIHRLYKTRLVSPIERNLTIAGLILSIAIVVNIFPAVFSVALSQSSFLISCSILATAVNSFFCIKSIIIPPLKNSVEYIFSKWGNKIIEEYPPEVLLDEKKDSDVLRILLELRLSEKIDLKSEKKKEYKETQGDRLARINKMLVKLYSYKNKYNNQFLGSIFRRDDIQKIENAMTEITIDGKLSSANDFILTKAQRKAAKIHRLQDAMNALEPVISKGNDWTECNKKASEYFDDFVSVRDVTGMSAFWKEGRSIFDKEIALQTEKHREFDECLPPNLSTLRA